ncbi:MULTISPECIES: hypothetical protein [unclassified Streptomyces]|uniref:hypothetical protein n=1 Tax=unclassified Streptomyces TaxID=2593676 RepID=UPI002ED5C53C|nr:hypothetical protein OH827_20295 [Streptomyces sp. NBC_00891]WSY07199.1 hypothetical protein OG464_20295 [Streptomyces sp. NBC_00890]WSZ08826.1 hypothetical protein OG704_20300 [Streptomyces sp. NBC_00869]WSZ23676.1 hypothetical protein OG498_13270 [Streptomyces sp. NBC_00870]
MSTVPPPEHPDDRPGEGREPSSISDEQWEAFQREAAEDRGGKVPEEPSARARMVTRRLREQDEAAAGRRRWWQRRKRTPEPALPPGWRTGPAWQEMNGRRGRLRTVRSVLVLALVAGVTLVVIRPSLLLDRLPGHHAEAAAADASPLPAETARPSAAPVDQAGLPDREHPFRGSPAERWASGAGAIELPEAKAVGGMSKADVALALRLTKEFLVGTNLDPAVLRGGQPTAAMALLDPKEPGTLPDLRRALRDPDEKHDPVNLVTRFDPAEAVPAGDVVKVRGRMTFAAGERGQVRVHADYTFVYPVARADGDGGVTRTIVRRDLTTALMDPARWQATRGKLGLYRYTSEAGNSACDVHDGYYHPAFGDRTPTGASPSGPARDPYDRHRSLYEDKDSGCGTVTRT